MKSWLRKMIVHVKNGCLNDSVATSIFKNFFFFIFFAFLLRDGDSELNLLQVCVEVFKEKEKLPQDFFFLFLLFFFFNF